MAIYQSTPYVFAPNPNADNGPGIRSALLAGYRWIQINGATCPLSTRVDLNRASDKFPYHGLVIEPAPGVSKVTINASGIGRNPSDPTDPSYAAFDYQGNVRPASYLTQIAHVNTTQIFVADPSQYTNGDWVVISDASTDFATQPLPLDGPMEVRQVIYVLSDSLVINEVIKREHPLNAIVALCTPITNVYIRGLEFTGNCAVGAHLHYAQHCTFDTITSTTWRGRSMLLIDNGGSNNLIINSYCTGTEVGVGPTQNAWGVVVEGQDSTRLVNSGGERCGNGTAMNYCIDTVSVNARARLNNVNVNPNFGSTRSGYLRPRIGSPLIADSIIGADCVDCYVFEPLPFS